MKAYYNEIDPFAAAWLRELIREGLIADGEVDERSIVDVGPGDVAGFNQCHFFAGIGGWSYALRLAGWPDDRPVWTGSCPCPPFSAAGKKKSCPDCGGTNPIPCPRRTGYFICCVCQFAWLADERHLWPELWRLIRDGRPAVVFGEQVAGQDGLVWLALVRASLEILGLAVGATDLPACSVEAFHERERLWWLADTQHAERWALSFNRQDERDRTHSGRTQTHGQPRARREVRELAYGNGEGCEWGPVPRLGTEQPTWHDDAGRGQVGSLDHAERERAEREARSEGREERQAPRDRQEQRRGLLQVEHAGATGDMGDTNGSRHALGVGESRDDGASIVAPERQALIETSPWSGCDWVYCRDDKWRAIEPSTFPLAHGVSARVGRLRGYGNAIVPQVAAEVIRAYMDVVDQKAGAA